MVTGYWPKSTNWLWAKLDFRSYLDSTQNGFGRSQLQDVVYWHLASVGLADEVIHVEVSCTFFELSISAVSTWLMVKKYICVYDTRDVHCDKMFMFTVTMTYIMT